MYTMSQRRRQSAMSPLPSNQTNGRQAMRRRTLGKSLVLGALAAAVLGLAAQAAEVPAPGASPKIDAIKKRGVLKVAAIGEFPWLPENTTGSGPQYSAPAWLLDEEYPRQPGGKLEVIQVSHETKVPILGTGEADISIAPLSVTPK